MKRIFAPVLLALLFGSASATVAAAPSDVVIISRTDIKQLAIGEDEELYRKIQSDLMNKVEVQFLDRGMRVEQAKTEQDLARYPHKHLLAFKIENLEFGFKGPLGRHTSLTVSYVLEGQKGVLTKGEYKEQSKTGWKKCVQALSQKMADDVADRMAGKEERKRETIKND